MFTRAAIPLVRLGPCRKACTWTLWLCGLTAGWPAVAAAQVPTPTPTPPPGVLIAPPAGTAAPGGATATPPGVIVAPTPTPGAQPAEVLFEQDGGTTPTGGLAVPLPLASSESPPVTLIVRQMDIAEVFNRIRQQTGLRVTALGTAVNQKLDLVARNTPVEEVLTQIATTHGWRWIRLPNGDYEVMDRDTYVQRVLKNQVIRVPFELKYIDAEEMNTVLQTVLTPEIGASAADARTNKIIVTDLPDKIALIESIIREYDIQLYTRVFEIRHARVQDVADRLGEIKSKSAELQVDARNRLIIAKDTFEKIKLMEQLVEILDRDQEMRVYNVVNIGDRGADVEELISKFIQPLVSDDGILQYNVATGKLFVRDIPSVHQKILDILQQLDQPRKQVLIEGEVLSVLLDHQLNWGAQWAYSNNLRGVIGAGQGGLGGTTGEGGGFDATGLPLTRIGSGGLSVLQLTESVKMELNAALKDSRTNLLLRPRLIIADQQEGSFSVERNDPILNTFFSGINDNFRSAGQQFIPSGLRVFITPRISNRGLVELDIDFENTKSESAGDIGQGVQGIRTSGDYVKTVMLIPSGETRVIGGLISEDASDSATGVPYLSRLPAIGWLFGTRTRTHNKRNLLFFITPTIIEEAPANDRIVEPVNDVARAAMTAAALPPIPVESRVNPIPPELEPYLRTLRRSEIRIEDDGTTTLLRTDTDTTGTATHIEDRTTTGTSARAILTDRPYERPGAAQPLRAGGIPEPLTGAIGAPRGTFGATPRPVGISTRPVTASGATTPTTPARPGAGPTEGPPPVPTPTPGGPPRTETVIR